MKVNITGLWARQWKAKGYKVNMCLNIAKKDDTRMYFLHNCVISTDLLSHAVGPPKSRIQ